MLIYVDIDETICTGSVGTDYATAQPVADRISKINDLFDKGHTIVYWTARGTRTGKNWYRLTEEQLKDWGAKHDELRMGKPAYDLFIDDKNISSEKFFSER